MSVKHVVLRMVLVELTRIRKTRMFCSANLLAMQDLVPWPKGNTRYE